MSTTRKKYRVGELRPSQVLFTYGIGSICASPFRGCTKRLVEPSGMDEFLWPDKPFQKETVGVFVQIGFRS